MKLHLSVNLALSADGKISDAARRPSGWTSRRDHHRLLALRRGADALMVGRRTLLADHMTLRVPGSGPQPLRCIVSRHGIIPPDHPLLHSPGGDIHLLATARPPEPGSHPDIIHHEGSLDSFLHSLYHRQGARHIHCEGGGTLVRLLLELDAVDEIHLTLAGHTVFGGQNCPTLSGTPIQRALAHSARFLLHEFEPDPATGECYLSYRRAPANQ